jgi:hypothetical protein
MTATRSSERGFSRQLTIFSLTTAAIAVFLFFWGSTLRRYVRESLMQRVTSAHYEILCPPGTLSRQAMADFASQREPQFTRLNKKLRDVDSNSEIRIIFDPNFPVQTTGEAGEPPYTVTGTTIRTSLNGDIPRLPIAADAEALLYGAWGEPGNPQSARWTAVWLVGQWRGAEIGMAAAQVEQRLGHTNLVSVLRDPGGEISSPDDQTLLGAAWASQIDEFGGADTVRKLYALKMPHPSVVQVAKALGTTPLELDRKWQLWMYAYLAGMPSMQGESGMPMNMQMSGRQ